MSLFVLQEKREKSRVLSFADKSLKTFLRFSKTNQKKEPLKKTDVSRRLFNLSIVLLYLSESVLCL